MYALYLKKNNASEKTMYPFCEFDMTAAAGYATFTGFQITPPASYTGSDLTCYNIIADGGTTPALLPQIANSFDENLNTDPRSEIQPYYFNADTYRDCFQSVGILNSEPADWTSTYNSMYYQEIYLGAGSCFMSQPKDFVPNFEYFKNETLSGVYETDEGMAFGISIGYVYRNGQYWFDAVYGHKLMLDGYANLAEIWQYYVPQMTGFPSTRILGGFGTVEFNMGTVGLVPDTPNSPDDACTMLVHGTYQNVDYYGVLCYRINTETGKCIAYRVYMLPAWCWGEAHEYEPPEPPEPVIPDPQDYGDESWAEGGGGTLTDSNDVPSEGSTDQIISGSFAAAHGMHIYELSASDYNTLMAALYGSDSTTWGALWNRWQNYLFNPVSGVISSHCMPVALVSLSTTSEAIKIAGTEIVGTNATLLNDRQVVTTTIGTLSIPEFFGNAFDYSPLTRMSLFLPFCGWIEIDPDYVTGGSLTVKYKTDVASGDICAYVICTDRKGATTYMYTATGNCAVDVPVVASKFDVARALGGTVAGLAGVFTGNVPAALIGGMAVLSSKNHTQTTGNYSGSKSLVGDHQCRLQITRPVLAIPQYGQMLRGRPSEVGILIGQLVGTGWNSFEAVHVDIEGATADECIEIERLLKYGVIL